MNVFFTADLHLGHANIIKYAGRPELRSDDLNPDGSWVSEELKEKRAKQMNERLIAKWNSRVKPEDTVYHLGDFCYKGRERGVDGERTKAQEWLARLNGTKVMILGNHDANNSLSRGLDIAFMAAGGLQLCLVHDPSSVSAATSQHLYDVIVCGHVHTAWSTKWVNGSFAVNVGVDMRKYAPVRLDELIGIIMKERQGWFTKKNSTIPGASAPTIGLMGRA